jgi:hypothetical protein
LVVDKIVLEEEKIRGFVVIKVAKDDEISLKAKGRPSIIGVGIRFAWEIAGIKDLEHIEPDVRNEIILPRVAVNFALLEELRFPVLFGLVFH